MQSAHKKVLSRIYGNGRGWCFSQIDFTDFASRSAVDSILKRLASAGTIRRILRGLYDYPTYSDFLGETLAPDIKQVVDALCRKHGWQVVPDGSTALHLLGLDTQIPARFWYLSSGPNREYLIGGTLLQFVHQKAQHTTIDDPFKERDAHRVVTKTRRVTSWVHDEILRIARMTERSP
jgi:hypothetical protein